ncbi:MAG: hypothetical protein WC268_04500 [Patescibacteria group bacterium]|jgi:hypothetical protein
MQKQAKTKKKGLTTENVRRLLERPAPWEKLLPPDAEPGLESVPPHLRSKIKEKNHGHCQTSHH